MKVPAIQCRGRGLAGAALPSPASPVLVGGKRIAMILRIHEQGHAQLSLIIDALDAFGPYFCARQCRQQHRREDRDNRDHYQQLNQCKSGNTPLSSHNGLITFNGAAGPESTGPAASAANTPYCNLTR